MFSVFSVQPDSAKCGNDVAVVLCCSSPVQISCRLGQRIKTELSGHPYQSHGLSLLIECFIIKKKKNKKIVRHCLREIFTVLAGACEHPGALDSSIAVILLQWAWEMDLKQEIIYIFAYCVISTS